VSDATDVLVEQEGRAGVVGVVVRVDEVSDLGVSGEMAAFGRMNT
jgi:hypothetical protein